MIRVTIEMLPGGSEDRKSIIGCMEISKLGSAKALAAGTYAVVLKKTPPFSGALRDAWRKGRVAAAGMSLDTVAPGEDDESVVAVTAGHKPPSRGVYDLLFRALLACGVNPQRNPHVEVPADLFQPRTGAA